MKEKELYTPAEVLEIARHYANLRESMRYQLSTLELSTELDSAEESLRNIPETVKKVIDLRDFLMVSNAVIKEKNVDSLIKNIRIKGVRYLPQDYKSLF
ncbi:MAG TPA: hypothetical protein VJB35_04485 [Candidatus Nanoarchaeia archaeon]|nr:hypothetical protein [Candidatus Nanoarchaeia archaeon]